jgi:hypothetical protein
MDRLAVEPNLNAPLRSDHRGDGDPAGKPSRRFDAEPVCSRRLGRAAARRCGTQTQQGEKDA